MSLENVKMSIMRILNNSHINKTSALLKYACWQIRILGDCFPYVQSFSKSRITARRDCGVCALVNCHDLYDYNNMNLVKYLLREGGVFFDIGANIGTYTIIAAEQTAAKVFSFEPHPITFEYLKSNVALNNLSNVSLNQFAFTHYNGNIGFTDTPGGQENCICDLQYSLVVNCCRAEDFCESNGVLPNIVKIDVEGSENLVLRGFGKVINDVDLFLIEILMMPEREKTNGEILKTMAEHNFRGPYYYDHEQRKFQEKTLKIPEDLIFVSPGMRSSLTDDNFGFIENV